MKFKLTAAALAAALLLGSPSIAATIYTFEGTFETYSVTGNPDAVDEDILPIPRPFAVSFEVQDLHNVSFNLYNVLMTVDGLGTGHGSGVAMSDRGRGGQLLYIYFNGWDVSPNSPGHEDVNAHFVFNLAPGHWNTLTVLDLTPDTLNAGGMELSLSVGLYGPDGNAGLDMSTGGLSRIEVQGEPIHLPIPEPSKWALMVMGFALAGSSLRAQRSAQLH